MPHSAEVGSREEGEGGGASVISIVGVSHW